MGFFVISKAVPEVRLPEDKAGWPEIMVSSH
jgi:hypothetical protein